MLINRNPHHTIWYNATKSCIEIIDQRLLPFKFEILELYTAKDAWNAIHNMAVRGAPLIGVTAAYGFWLGIKAQQCVDRNNIEDLAAYLKSARPTAVNLAIAIGTMVNAIGEAYDTAEKTALQKAHAIKQYEIDNCYNIGLHGVKLIEEISKKKRGQTVNILTHCNAGWLACVDWGTATAPVYMAQQKGIDIHVWVDETRPRNQGARLTAFELLEQGVPHTVIPDNTGGHLMQHGMVDLVIVGSDRTTRWGDVANKIGTYLKALAANDNNVPFYVALPSTSFDFSMQNGVKEIPIEQRGKDEVRLMEGVLNGEMTEVLIMPEKSPVVNYGFDITPARLVSGFITERGICNADEKSISTMFNDCF